MTTFWDKINRDHYHFVLKAKGINNTCEVVKEFLIRNIWRVPYRHIKDGYGYYPLIEKERLRLAMKFQEL